MRLDDGSAKEKCTNANDEYADYMEPFHVYNTFYIIKNNIEKYLLIE